MPAPSKIDRYKLDAEFSTGTITHTKRLQDGQRIDTPGTTWTREKKLGAGGFGTVWRERHAPTGELRAVKVLSKLQLNVREVEALVDLQDYPTYFITFLGWFDDMHTVYIAMEYMAHGDLTQYIIDHPIKARTEARDITWQILNGLVVLHKREICHRDLKPQNILIASVSPIWVKITDFGISKQSMGTSLRTSCGTPSYQAPEQVGLLPRKLRTSARDSYTKAVDLWALGAVIHQILTTEIPFRDTYDMDSMTDITIQFSTANLEPTIDSEMVYEYCRSAKFPVEILERNGAEPEAIDLIKRLMVPDPRSRISATDALESSWFPQQQVLRSQFQMLGFDISPEDANRMLAETREMIQDILHSPEISQICDIQGKAVSMGYLEVMKVLFKVIDITASSGGLHFMQIAAGKGQVGAIMLLLNRGATVISRPQGEEGQNPMHWASAGGHLDAIRLLLDRGANPNAAPDHQNSQTALHGASAAGHLDAIRLLLDRGANPNSAPRHQNSQTALYAASVAGHIDAIRLLLDRGADPNATQNTQNSQTPLHGASAGGHLDAIPAGHLDAIRLLLDRGADPNVAAIGQNGQSPLHGASAGGHLDAIRLLLDRGADPNVAAIGQNGQSPLHGASAAGHLDAIRLLLDRGANPNVRVQKEDAQSSLHAAAAGGHTDVINRLLDKGAIVNSTLYQPSPNCVGLRPLHLAADGGHLDAVQLLLARGAEVGDRPLRVDLDPRILAILKEHNQ
ncbi:hypothetical protein Q9L58_006258 [Maublancomyces gigas]|uniref:Protein kinase domain-containing protein n=1 Tax=Discina gigas TaxID=1032678 RepID=A0ABR3GGB9_9PEZI